MKNESISTKKIVMTAFFCSYYLSGNPVFPYSASGGCRNTISAFRTHFRNACSINAWT